MFRNILFNKILMFRNIFFNKILMFRNIFLVTSARVDAVFPVTFNYFNAFFLRQDNNYRTLKAFQKAECIYDVTFYFAHKFLAVGDRTIDQMVQAARSGKQNLAEGNIDGKR